MTSDVVSIDLFAGGGGASLGICRATGRAPIVAINHCLAAILMHRANHPQTIHYRENVWDVDPVQAAGCAAVDLLWASPDCTHFSRAKGGKPRSREIRSLAWVVVEWAFKVHPTVICLENVPEFVTWGPLGEDGQPDPTREGETFEEFTGALRDLGYAVEWRVLCAADYGAPTTRRRLFLVARRDGQPIAWPTPSHGPGRQHPYRTAAECIDWSIPCPSIFERTRPLAEATLRRIAAGLRRYVLDAEHPYLVTLPEGGGVTPLAEPERTAAAANRGEHGLVAPVLIQTGYGERDGQAPRALDLSKPLGTVVAGGAKHAIVAAFLAKHYGGVVGQSLRAPIGTVTAKDHHSLVCAFLTKYYSAGGTAQGVDEPLHTIVSKARFGLVEVVVDGEPYTVTDIGMRMLQPRELARAQGFPDSYLLTGSKTEQIARIGNSVCPCVVEALVRGLFQTTPERQVGMFGAQAA